MRREVMRDKEKRKEKKECRNKRKWVHEWSKEKKKKKWEMKNWGKFMREDQKFWREAIATF